MINKQHVLINEAGQDMPLTTIMFELLNEDGVLAKDELLSTDNVTRYRLQEIQKD